MNKICKPKFKKLIQVGMVVGNLEKTLKKYVYDYGIEPFYILKFSPHNVRNMYIHGKKENYSMNIGVCPIGDVRFELIEPLDQSMYSEFYNNYGENIVNHLKLEIENYEKTLKYLQSCGIKVLQSGHQLGIAGMNKYNYLSTSDSLSFILEIVDISSDFIKPGPDYWFPKEKEGIPLPVFKGISQVGIVVDNLKEKIRKYEDTYNIGPWHIEEYNSDNIKDMFVYENRKDYSMKIAFCVLGNIQFKLIEPLDESIYSEFYNRYEGKLIHHLRMDVDDYHGVLNYLRTKGVEIIQSGNYLGKLEYSYLSTDKDISFIIEIIDNKDKNLVRYCP